MQIKTWLSFTVFLFALGASSARTVHSVRIVAVQPDTLISGERARLSGDGLVFTWQANPSSTFVPSRMLRLGNHYLRINASRVSDDGRELLLELAPEGALKRVGASDRYLPDPSAPTELQGPVGLLSLTASSASDPDVITPFSVRWRRQGAVGHAPTP